MISPGEWSRRQYWRIAGPTVGAGALAAVLAALVGDPEGRRALFVLALFVFVSDTGIGWERLTRDEHFGLNWDEVAEVRVLTVAYDGLVLRVVDVFPVADSVLGQRPELRPFWEVGAAMAAFRPERYREFTAELEPVRGEAPPTPITRGAT